MKVNGTTGRGITIQEIQQRNAFRSVPIASWAVYLWLKDKGLVISTF